jgi:AraC-like DNA-binding protein
MFYRNVATMGFTYTRSRGEKLSNPAYERLKQVRELIDASPHLPLDLERLSSHAGYSRYHFLRLFQQAFRQTPHQYLVTRRIEKAKALLADERHSVTEVCFAVGFQSPGSFSSLFCRSVGQSPAAYRARLRMSPPFVPMCFQSMLGLAAPQFSRS